MQPFTSFPKVDPNSPLIEQGNLFQSLNHAKSTIISATIDLKMRKLSSDETRIASDETKHIFSLSDHPTNWVKIMEDADAKEPSTTPMKSIPVNMDKIIKNSIDSIVASHGQPGLMTVVLWAHVLFGGCLVNRSFWEKVVSEATRLLFEHTNGEVQYVSCVSKNFTDALFEGMPFHDDKAYFLIKKHTPPHGKNYGHFCWTTHKDGIALADKANRVIEPEELNCAFWMASKLHIMDEGLKLRASS